jgi:hypothetical protein
VLAILSLEKYEFVFLFVSVTKERRLGKLQYRENCNEFLSFAWMPKNS